MDINIERRKTKHTSVRLLVDEAQLICKEFFKEDYKYCDAEAVEELGLDSELIDQLLEDYVIQVVKSIEHFKEHLKFLKNEKENAQELNFTPFRELAHKNLGVARNLRIKDSEKILTTLMKDDDLDKLENCLNILKCCVIKLKPMSAYASIELLKLKDELS